MEDFALIWKISCILAFSGKYNLREVLQNLSSVKFIINNFHPPSLIPVKSREQPLKSENEWKEISNSDIWLFMYIFLSQ